MNAPLPFWPAMLKRDRAMAYVSLTAGKFEAAMSSGQIPYPVQIAGVDLWSRAQMDEYLERLTGGGQPDWRKNAPAYQGRLD